MAENFHYDHNQNSVEYNSDNNVEYIRNYGDQMNLMVPGTNFYSSQDQNEQQMYGGGINAMVPHNMQIKYFKENKEYLKK